LDNYINQHLTVVIKSWNGTESTLTPPAQNLTFNYVENRPLSLVAKDDLNNQYVFNFNANVLRGNAVKIKKIKISNINSLSNISNCAFSPNIPSFEGFGFAFKFPNNQQFTTIKDNTELLPLNDNIEWVINNFYIKPELNYEFKLFFSVCYNSYPNMVTNINLEMMQVNQPIIVNYTINNYSLSIQLELEWP